MLPEGSEGGVGGYSGWGWAKPWGEKLLPGEAYIEGRGTQSGGLLGHLWSLARS